MKGKKLLAGILSAAMVLATTAFPAFADGSTAIVATTGELQTALANPTVTEITIKGTIDTQGVDFSTVDGITIKGNLSDGEDILKFSGAYRTISITFSDVTLEWPNANYQGLQHSTLLTYNNCKIKGQPFLYAENEIFNDCTFIQDSSDAYNVWTYGAKNVKFNNCTFNSAGKSVLIYNEGALTSGSVNVQNCTFNASASVKGKAAIEIDSTYSNYSVNIDAQTTATGFAAGSTSGSSLYNVKNYKVVTGADNSKKLNTEIKVNGETVVPLSDEKQAVVFGDCVAQIGDKYYTTLNYAVAAAESGDTVTILTDCTLDTPIEVTKNLTFVGDSENHPTLTNSKTDGRVFNINDNTEALTVNIKNINIVADGSAGSAYPRGISMYQNNGLTLNIDNCEITCGWYPINVASNNTDLVVNVNNSIINGWSILNIWSSGTKITMNDSKCLSLNDKSLSEWNNFSAIVCNEGVDNINVVLNNTDIECKSLYGNDQDFTSFRDDTANNTLTINGGTYTGYTNFCDSHATAGYAVSITGGTFSSDVSEYCADGYTTALNADGTYGVEKVYAAHIGDAKYATLADAVAAAQNGDTVTLLGNASGDGIKIPSGSNITIDFNGFTYNVDGTTVGSSGTETNGFQLLKNSNITFKNGTITSDKAKILIQNYSNLTLENMTLDGSNLPGSNRYVLSNNNGDTVLTGNTNIIAKAGDIAFDVCRYANYPSVTVTLDENMTGTINGNIELSDSADSSSIGAVDADSFNLIIKAGTVKGAISDLRSTTQKNFADFGKISGGTFTTDVSTFLADGYALNANEDGTYGVEKETEPEILKKSLYVTYSQLGKFDFGSGEVDSIKLSLFAGVDSLNYSEVGFDVTLNGEKQTFPVTVVYDSVKTLIDGKETIVAASEFGNGVNHVFGYTVNFPATAEFENASVKWVPYAIKNKVKITGNIFELGDIFPGTLEVSE